MWVKLMKLFLPSGFRGGPLQPCRLPGSWRDAALLHFTLRNQVYSYLKDRC